MKEFYIAPEVEIVNFAPIEELASQDPLWDGFYEGEGESYFFEGSGSGSGDGVM